MSAGTRRESEDTSAEELACLDVVLVGLQEVLNLLKKRDRIPVPEVTAQAGIGSFEYDLLFHRSPPLGCEVANERLPFSFRMESVDHYFVFQYFTFVLFEPLDCFFEGVNWAFPLQYCLNWIAGHAAYSLV